MQAAAAKAAGLPVEKVTVHNHLLGGGFGRRLEPDMAVEAARIAKQVDGPVKVVWTREEDIRHDIYRPALSRHPCRQPDGRQDRRLETQGHRLGGHGALAAAGLPERRRPRRASIAPWTCPTTFPTSTSNISAPSRPAVPTGFWRGVGPNNNVFAIESFIDELARKAGKDPVAFRRAHAGKQRRACRRRWTWSRRSPAGASRCRRAPGAASACSRRSRSFIATVVEAEVDEHGEVQLRRVTSAVDTGIAVNPDTIVAQLQGGLIFGLTAALYGEITIDKGRVQQSNFNDYRMLRIDQAPRIDVHLIKSGEAPGGIGETGATAGPPALRNAIYAATGVALRRLPIDRALLAGRKA